MTSLGRAGFFVLRTPALPIDTLLEWAHAAHAALPRDDGSTDQNVCERLRSALRALIDDPLVREALLIASPDLSHGIAAWARSPQSDRGQKAERALMRYLSRMATRPTPFGLFAAWGTGTFGSVTELRAPARNQLRRVVRLDSGYVTRLATALSQTPGIRSQLHYKRNSSLYRLGDQVFYIETHIAGNRRGHAVVSVTASPELQSILDLGGDAHPIDDYVAAIVTSETEPADARTFVDELIDAQILISELEPALTGAAPAEQLVGALSGVREGLSTAAAIIDANACLSELSEAPFGLDEEAYRRALQPLESAAVAPDGTRGVQVDLMNTDDALRISPALQARIDDAITTFLRAAWTAPNDGLADFRGRFEERFGDQEIPLLRALDPDAGVSFEDPGGETSAAAVIGAMPKTTSQRVDVWSKRYSVLLRLLSGALAAGAEELVLTERDLAELEFPNRDPLPQASTAVLTLAAASYDAVLRGDCRVIVDMVSGPSGVRPFGRFCYADARLRTLVRSHLREEERAVPEAIFAEVVHLANGRVGNVASRPLLRTYEIEYLGTSGARPEHRIEANDLMVSVSAGRIVLRSTRLNREVIPRLTTAHNTTWEELAPVYRFLGALQGQHTASTLRWAWGPLGNAARLPRVRHGHTILARQRWRIDVSECAGAGQGSIEERAALVAELRSSRRLPRFVTIADDDNVLPFDLENALSADAFAQWLCRQRIAEISEMLPAPDGVWLEGPGGRYAHELFIAYSAEQADSPFTDQSRLRPLPIRPEQSVDRQFPPGTRWIYVRFYLGARDIDHVLMRVAAAIKALAEDVSRWFFIRYADPHWHLRVRVEASSAAAHDRVRVAMEQIGADMLAESVGWRVEFGTYDREILRYGGPSGIDDSESVFDIDSRAVVDILKMIAGESSPAVRWQLILRGADALLDAFGFDLQAKRRLVHGLRDHFFTEFGGTSDLRRSLSAGHRANAAATAAALQAELADDPVLRPFERVMTERADALRVVAGRLRRSEREGRLTSPLAEIVGSFAHMFVNRLARSAHRAQELVLYDRLDRYYTSRIARDEAGACSVRGGGDRSH